MSNNPARRAVLISCISFVLSYGVARGLLEQPLEKPLAIAAALFPVPFFVWWLVMLVRSAKYLDELQRRIHLEALTVAYPLVLVFLLTLGLLELAIELNPDDWSYRHAWAYMPLFYFIGLGMARKRYE
jgi:hypothetical protein